MCRPTSRLLSKSPWSQAEWNAIAIWSDSRRCFRIGPGCGGGSAGASASFIRAPGPGPAIPARSHRTRTSRAGDHRWGGGQRPVNSSNRRCRRTSAGVVRARAHATMRHSHAPHIRSHAAASWRNVGGASLTELPRPSSWPRPWASARGSVVQTPPRGRFPASFGGAGGGWSPPSRITASSARRMASGRVGFGSASVAIHASRRASCSGGRRRLICVAPTFGRPGPFLISDIALAMNI